LRRPGRAGNLKAHESSGFLIKSPQAVWAFFLFQDSPAEDEIPDLIAFWQTRLNTPRWSQIARMALSIHSIPAMSAEVKRVFSSSKLFNSDRRNRLGVDVICAVECMKSWEKAGIVESNEVRKMEEMLRAMEIQPEKREIAGCQVLPTKVRACTHWSLPKTVRSPRGRQMLVV
jgi:hypothetical protein